MTFAPILQHLEAKTGTVWVTAVVTLTGAALLIACSFIRIPLPFTPVPITGQTFAVMFLALTVGWRNASLSIAAYLTAGLAGIPIFAGQAATAALFGPSAGYLLGFLIAGVCVAYVQEKLRLRSVISLFALALVGHTVLLVIGASVLALFVGAEHAWAMGIWPFLGGDIIKSLGAATAAYPLIRQH